MRGVKRPKKNPREVVQTIAPNHVVLSSIKDLPFPLKNRHFVYESMWAENSDGSFIYAWRPCKEETYRNKTHMINFGNNKISQLVRADSRGFCTIKPVTHQLANDSCVVTWVQQLDAKGRIPPKIAERNIPRSLELISRVCMKFNISRK